MQGCLCDPGWEGFDCSFRKCPVGVDPTVHVGTAPEYSLLHCQATSGFFSIRIAGYDTQPIPWDADPAYLKIALEAGGTVSGVQVEMQSINGDGLPYLCGTSQYATTKITWTSTATVAPRIRLSLLTANTRSWPTGSTKLNINGLAPVLRMSTEHYLNCPACPSCSGYLYFVFEGVMSSAVSVTSQTTNADIANALSTIPQLNSATSQWTNIQFDITGNVQKICDPSYASSYTIRLLSDYGNMPFLEMIDTTGSGVITFSTNAGSKQLYECSRNGYCDRNIGRCNCFEHKTAVTGQSAYRTMSSDGNGNPGGNGDCGYIEQTTTSCYLNGKDICGQRGTCSNSTDTCVCHDGWYGITCQWATCPKGAAWFDEPLTATIAHQSAECSNMGMCDRSTGTCSCKLGYSGSACQYRDCPFNTTSGSPFF